MGSAERELLAAREEVWRFLAEPRHLADWWPGIVAVEPDRRGFAEGARWQVARAEEQTLLVGFAGRLPSSGRSARSVTETLLVTRVHPFELWAWELVGRRKGVRQLRPLHAEVRLQSPAPGRTRVQVTVSTPALFRWTTSDERTARTAAGRLYDLVQTAASF